MISANSADFIDVTLVVTDNTMRNITTQVRMEMRRREFMHKASIEACLYGLGAKMKRGDPIKADGDCPFSATLSQVITFLSHAISAHIFLGNTYFRSAKGQLSQTL